MILWGLIIALCIGGGIWYLKSRQSSSPAPVTITQQPAPKPALPIEVEFPNIVIPKDIVMPNEFTLPYELTGTLHPPFVDHPSGEWRFLDSANSSSSRVINFSGNHPEIIWARWSLIWNPTNSNQYARLVAAPTDAVPPVKDWPSVVVIQALPYNGVWGPRPDRAIVTDFFRQARLNKKDLYVGWQICGDAAAMSIYESLFELHVGI